MKTHAFFAASLLIGVALLPLPAGAEPADQAATAPEAPEETIVVEEAPAESSSGSSDDEPAQTIDVSSFQETALPDSPEPHFSDAGLLQGDLPEEPAEPAGPLKKGTAEQLRQVIRIRQLRTIAQRDPVIRNERLRAEAARTPEGRRTLLRNYYVLVYNRMVHLEPSLKAELEADLIVKLNRLEQKNIRPSQLVEPYQPLPGSRVQERTVIVTTTETVVKEQE